MSLFVALCLLVLVTLAVRRWLTGYWLPIHSEHVPLDFPRLTINGIPIEMLYGPDAVHHPYLLSEPDEYPPLLMERPLVEPPLGGYFNADLAIWQAAARLSAQQMKPGDLLRHINPC